jgi:hypothetical protein
MIFWDTIAIKHGMSHSDVVALASKRALAIANVDKVGRSFGTSHFVCDNVTDTAHPKLARLMNALKVLIETLLGVRIVIPETF